MRAPVIVYIVDDDLAVRTGFARLLRSAGLEARAYGNPMEFLANVENHAGACVLLDITMPGMTGLQVQAQLAAQGITLPVITISGREEGHLRSSAHALGAHMFLRKPVDDQALLDAINWVVNADKRSD